MSALKVIAVAGVSLLVLSIAACESATNLDVSYVDAGPAITSEASASAAEAGVINEGGPSLQTSEVLPGCPCDESQGLGCCIPAVGQPFCTGDSAFCAEAKGIHVKCSHPDPLTESVCCWRSSTSDAGASGMVAALSGSCAGASSACTADTDCAGTGQTKCSLATCAGGTITIGTCGPTPPACPQP